jgi:hypothetical protein
MNYLESFLQEKKRSHKDQERTDKTAETRSVSFVSESRRDLCASFSPIEEAEIDRLAKADGWKPITPAESIIATCRRHGIALSLEPNGALRVGTDGGNGDEPAPWPSLIIAIEAHMEPVAALVAAGWHLRADAKASAA